MNFTKEANGTDWYDAWSLGSMSKLAQTYPHILPLTTGLHD